MYNFFIIILGKFIFWLINFLKLGSGSTWPGHIALKLNKNFISNILSNSKTRTIIVAGTNGKTTTAKLIQSILITNKNSVLVNQEGANLLNGVASALILNSNTFGRIAKDYAIFEIDENTVPLILSEFTPDYLIGLNLFRDQLDRYGEVNTIAKNWKKKIDKLPKSTTLILNADDPMLSSLNKNTNAKTLFFGIDDAKLSTSSRQNAADSIYCPSCNNKLSYKEIYFSHLGNWYCKVCKNKRAELDYSNTTITPLPGVYNVYNALAASLVTHDMGINSKVISHALTNFNPAFGRQEVINVENKFVQFFLSKNPTSFNESLRTIKELGTKDILIILNDRIPDGRDISWIWDTNAEDLLKGINNIIVSGDRAFDMALRIKYAIGDKNLTCEPNLHIAIKKALQVSSRNLAILPTYSAMLEARKVLTGRKIL